MPYDTRFITDSPYTSYHRFGSDPLFNRDVENVNEMEHWGVASTVEWQASNNVLFKSITSYREFENTFGRDSDGTPLPVDHTWDTSIHEQLTQEFQITGLAADEKLDWATGFFTTAPTTRIRAGISYIRSFCRRTTTRIRRKSRAGPCSCMALTTLTTC